MMMISKFAVGCAVLFVCNPSPVFAREIGCAYIKCLTETDAMWDDDVMAPPNCPVHCRATNRTQCEGCMEDKCTYKEEGWFASGLHHCRACGRHSCAEALRQNRDPNGEINYIVMSDNKKHKSCVDCFAKAQEINKRWVPIQRGFDPSKDDRKESWRQYLMHIRLGFGTIDTLCQAIEWTLNRPYHPQITKQWNLISNHYRGDLIEQSNLKHPPSFTKMERLRKAIRTKYTSHPAFLRKIKRHFFEWPNEIFERPTFSRWTSFEENGPTRSSFDRSR